MKKFTKLFLSCAAAAALTAAVATSAMAADYKSLSATYALDEGGATGTVTITCDSQDEMKTLLVLNKGKDLTNFAAGDVLQIDQDGTIATVKLPALSKDNDSHKGTYMVYMGGTSGDIYAGSFTIGAEPVLVGDVATNGKVQGNDATAILRHVATIEGSVITDPKTLFMADVNGNGKVQGNDATCVLRKVAGLPDGTGNAGVEMDYSGE